MVHGWGLELYMALDSEALKNVHVSVGKPWNSPQLGYAIENASLDPIELNFWGPLGASTVIWTSDAFSGISFDPVTISF